MNKKPITRHAAALVVLTLFLLISLYSCSHRNTRPYRVARDSTWYPLTLLGKERNLVAFSDELLLAIAKEEEIQFQLSFASSDSLFRGLDQGEYDGILSSLPPTITNQELYYFSEPFYLLGPVLIVQEKSHYSSLEQMEGRSIGIKSGSTLVFNVYKYPSLLLISYDNIVSALNDLDKNIIDGVILDLLPAYLYTTGIYAGRLKIVTPPLNDAGLRLITRRTPDSRELIQDFNSGLKTVQKNGTYDTLLKKWGLQGKG